MTNNKSLIIVVFVSVLQKVFFIQQGYDLFTCFVGLPTDYSNGIAIMCLVAPVITILFFFNGMLSDYMSGYGVLRTVRGYSKTQTYFGVTARMIVWLGLIVVIQVLLECFAFRRYDLLFDYRYTLSLATYTFGLLQMILIQELISLYIPSHFASLLTSVLVLGSVLIMSFISKADMVFTSMRFLLFSSLMFGTNDGAPMEMGRFVLFCVFFAICFCITVLCSINRFKKRDII